MVTLLVTAAELADDRAEAESLMLDTFTIYSPSGRTTGGDGMESEGYTSQGTTSGKVAGPSAQSRDTTESSETVGDVARPVVFGGLHVPLSSPVPTMGDLGIGWEYQLTTLGPQTDPSLLNSRWLVVDSPAKSYATARRLDVQRLA